MKQTIGIIQQVRQNFISLMEGLSQADLNRKPANFNNNIIWNFGHLISSQQLLCYGLSGLPFKVDNEVIEGFRRGTKPVDFIPEADSAKLIADSERTLSELQTDYENGYFTQFNPYSTSFGVHLTSIEDAIRFLVVHEGLHLGYAMAIRRALQMK
jgi:hypothetical protein